MKRFLAYNGAVMLAFELVWILLAVFPNIPDSVARCILFGSYPLVFVALFIAAWRGLRNRSRYAIPIGILFSLIFSPIFIIVGLYLSAVVYYSGHDDLVSFPLPNGHKIHLFNDRHWDVDYCLLCEMDGPIIRHEPRCVAAILSGDSAPHFTIHSGTNGQIFWVTADTQPKAVLYVVDFESRGFWPGLEDGDHELAKGQCLLTLVNTKEAGYHFYDDEDIGVKKR